MPLPLNQTTINYLHQIPYFENFEETQLKEVAQEIEVRHCGEGEILFLQGERGAGLHLVVEGMCKIYSLSADGREQILYMLLPGDYCNEVSAVDNGSNPASFATIEQSTVWILTEPALNRLRQRYASLNDIIIKNLAKHARQLSARVYQLTFLSTKQRMALFLLKQCDDAGKIDRTDWPQDEIAAFIGTVRDVAGRILREFRDDHFIKMERNDIKIIDKDALERLIA